eukprot:TRINITY_DN14834_c0_g2_i1.p1 TRINITY_DN14834_c0_g2~~TRINITY_DN14834_c0_g2_i1.p1  ORF type:complete len:212 (+),score=39.75 TRINITY_DN14834_c0_g2_i1:33-668(+)
MGCSTSSSAGHADTKLAVRSQGESSLQIDLGTHASSSSQRETLERLPETSAASSAGAVRADPAALNLSDIDPVVDNEFQQAVGKKHDVEDAATPSLVQKPLDRQLSFSDSGSDFNSWSYDDDSQGSTSSRERRPKPASAKEHHDHISRLDGFLADVSVAPESLKRRVKHRRSNERLLSELKDIPQVELIAAPQPGVKPDEDSSDSSRSLSQ